MDAQAAAGNALACVLEAKKGESVVIFCDVEKMDVGKAFASGALKLDLQTRLVQLKTPANAFRKDIPPQIIEILRKKPADVYINLLRGIREETPFRVQLIKMETENNKARLGHCPGVTLEMLTKGALGLTVEQHRQMQAFADNVIEILSKAVKVEIMNIAGTNLSLSTEGRTFFTDTRIDWKTMKWMNLPTGEVIVAPVEDSLEGKLVCDVAIGGIGPIDAPVTIAARNGKAQNVSCEDTDVLRKVNDSLNTDEGSDIVGEFAFGINRKARFADEFLEAEKMFGTVHVAFGNNSDMPGGQNHSKNHMDFLLSKPTVRVLYEDGSSADVLVNGVFQHV